MAWKDYPRGSARVAQVAAEHGIKEDSVYDYIRVSQTWTEAQFLKLLSKGLTLSHLVLIARHRVKMNWQEWNAARALYVAAAVNLSIRGKLSVRALKRLLKTDLGPIP